MKLLRKIFNNKKMKKNTGIFKKKKNNFNKKINIEIFLKKIQKNTE